LFKQGILSFIELHLFSIQFKHVGHTVQSLSLQSVERRSLAFVPISEDFVLWKLDTITQSIA